MLPRKRCSKQILFGRTTQHNPPIEMALRLWPPAPPPKTNLGRHRPFAPLAGIHVSPLALGAMSIGDGSWDAIGVQDKETSFKLLDTFYEAGGNLIDTANN